MPRPGLEMRPRLVHCSWNRKAIHPPFTELCSVGPRNIEVKTSISVLKRLSLVEKTDKKFENNAVSAMMAACT